MVTQQQATASIATIGAVLAYVLWSIVGTGTFLPYIMVGTPHVGNIMLFLALLSLVLAAGVTVVLSLIMTLLSWLRKRDHGIAGTTFWTTFVAAFLLIFPAGILHVFSLVNIKVTLLSYAIVCGIVGYGKYKARHKYQKYLTAGSRTGESKDSVKV